MTLPEIIGAVYLAGGVFVVRDDQLIVSGIAHLPDNLSYAIDHQKDVIKRYVLAFGGQWPKGGPNKVRN